MRVFRPLLLSLVLSPFAIAQRLPDTVLPQHYSLQLTPNLQAATFAGTETIDVNLKAPSKTVTLNSLELDLLHISATYGSTTQPGTVSYDPSKEQATLNFQAALPANTPVQLHIQYTGILNDKLRGFYLSKTAKRRYAVTQFEATDARRAFPSFDEPAYKATFAIALTVDDGDTVISNEPQTSDVPAGPGKHTLTFATTPKMSTYLVAFQVGDFQCRRGSADGVSIGVCAPPDAMPLTAAALADAEHTLHYYDDYFGIKYPLPKLDMVAIPDFEAGAMENFGCITYRDTALLLDESHASLSQRKEVASVVAHEMAHQWFGDLVTMQWWNNLWLNEGFATWMAAKSLREWHPEWNIADDNALELDQVMQTDAAPTTRAVQSPADTPEQINQQFDGLSYGKAGAVLGMVEHYIGPETFRAGVHQYLQAHLYGNATAEDFWGAQTANSHQPVDRVMRSFVLQPGVPLLTFGAAQDDKVRVEQSRFYQQSAPTAQSWVVPVCTGDMCQLAQGPQSFVNSDGVRWLNGGEHGYFRSKYDTATLQQIIGTAETKLSAPERIGLLGDTWALTQAGSGDVVTVLMLAEQLRQDRNPVVLDAERTVLRQIARLLVTKDQQPAYEAWIRKTYAPVYAALPPQSASDDSDLKDRRAVLFALLGGAGDSAVLPEANRLTNDFLEGKAAENPEQQNTAIFVAASHGDAALYDKLQQYYLTASDPQSKTLALYALTDFREPALIKRTLDFAVSGKVSKQNSVSVITSLLAGRVAQDETWAYVQANWPAVSAQFTMSSGPGIVSATGTFCSDQAKTEAAAFFASHPVPASERTLRASQERIAGCVRFRGMQGAAFDRWLQTQ